MLVPQFPENDRQRVATLMQLDVLNGKQEERFDRITRIAAALFGVPISMINMITATEQINKSCFGLPSGGKMDRRKSFCDHTILTSKPTVIADATKDERFANNPNVTGGIKVRGYAGVPLRAVDGTHPGALCLVDTQAREFTDQDIILLQDLAAWAEIELNGSQLRQALDSANTAQSELQSQLTEARRLNELMVGRELKMADMKRELELLRST